MSDLAQLEQALVAAGDAGDHDAARVLAAEIMRVRQGPSIMDVPLGARREAEATPAWMAPVLGAGRIANRWVQGGKQPFLSGDAADAQADEMAASEESYGALKQKHPFLTAAGEVAATAVAKHPLAMAALGALEYGSPAERAARAGMGYAGAKAGEFAVKGLGRLWGSKAADTSKGIADRVASGEMPAPNKWNIPTTAAMRTDNRVVQNVSAALDNLPTSAGVMAKGKDRAFTGFNEAVGRQFGDDAASRITPELLGANQQRIGKTIGEIAERNSIQFDRQLFADIQAVEKKIAGELVPGEPGYELATRWVQNIKNATDANTGLIPGTLYKALQSDMGKIGKDRGGTVSSVMHELRAAMRDAMTRSVSPKDSAAWLKANEQYFNVQQVAQATRATPGSLSPAALLTQVNQSQKQAKFGGGNELAELAQWSKAHLPDKVPNSGTAQRAMWQAILQNPVTTAGAFGGAAYGANAALGGDVPNEAYAGLVIPYTMAHMLAGKPPSPLIASLMARGGAATGAVTADRLGGGRALAEALRRYAAGGAP